MRSGSVNDRGGEERGRVVIGENAEHGTGLLRAHDEGEPQVTPIELFFDLVYVLAVTQLSHHLLQHLSVVGALQTALLAVVVWRAWIDAAWLTNWFDPEQRVVRLVLVGMSLASLLMSATLPEAFGERGLFFAGAAVTMQVGRSLFAVLALRREPGLQRNFQRILAWSVLAGALWLIGGMVDAEARGVVWLAAVLVDVIAPAVGFVTPGLGRSHTTDWPITGGLLAERCRLFIILALGESILVTGATFGELPFTAAALAGVVIAFLGSVALWWVYFDRSADAANDVITRSPDPGRLGRSAYTYYHLPMMAGIIVTAVGDELIISDPTAPTSVATLAVVLGGPALFLAGHTLFKRAVFDHLSTPRLVALLVLAVLIPVGLIVPPLILAAAATLVVAGVALWDAWSIRHAAQPTPIPRPNEEGI
jgi:low temperature requirement protein LtrA